VPFPTFDTVCVGSPVIIISKKNVNKQVHKKLDFSTRVEILVDQKSNETSWNSTHY